MVFILCQLRTVWQIAHMQHLWNGCCVLSVMWVLTGFAFCFLVMGTDEAADVDLEDDEVAVVCTTSIRFGGFGGGGGSIWTTTSTQPGVPGAAVTSVLPSKIASESVDLNYRPQK